MSVTRRDALGKLGGMLAFPAILAVGDYDLPCDLTAGATCAYGIKPMARGWFNSPCMDVIIDGIGTTTTINFVGGVLDFASLIQFASAGYVRITKWYDHTGNGNHAVQSNVNLQPYVRVQTGNVLSTTGALVFDRSATNSTTDFRSLEIPAGASFSASASSVFCLASPNNVNLKNTLFELGVDTLNRSAIDQQIDNRSWYNLNGSTLKPVRTDLDVWWMVNGNGIGFGGVGENFLPPSPNYKAIGSPVGGTLGWSRAIPTLNGFLGEIFAFVAWGNLAMTAAQARAVRNSLYQQFYVPTGLNDNIVIEGDSLSTGPILFRDGSEQDGWATQMLPQLKRSVKTFNQSVGGRSTLQAVNEYATNVAPIFDPLATNNIILLFLGGNDTGALALLEGYISTYCAAAKATGWKIIICTELAWNYALYAGQNFCISTEQDRLNFNIFQRALSNKDAVADCGADPIMGNPQTSINRAPYYSNDQTHPIRAGNTILAGIMANSVNGLL